MFTNFRRNGLLVNSGENKHFTSHQPSCYSGGQALGSDEQSIRHCLVCRSVRAQSSLQCTDSSKIPGGSNTTLLHSCILELYEHVWIKVRVEQGVKALLCDFGMLGRCLWGKN